MSVAFPRGRSQIHANLTPLIDVTFLLIVFFVLVSQIVELETVPMDLPAPVAPATVMPGDDHRAVINVMPGENGSIRGYRLGNRTFSGDESGLAELIEHLARMYQATPNVNVNLRADRTTHYRHVEPVLTAIGQAADRAGLHDRRPRVNLVVIRER